MAFSDLFRKKRVDPEKAVRPEGIENMQPITKDSIDRAKSIFQEYLQGKQVFDAKTVDNEDFWKKRQYETFVRPGEKYIPASAWLWNAVINKHSQLVAAYPKFNVRPQQQDDESEAALLTEIMPIVLRQAGYRKVYSQTMRQKVIQGTGVTGVFWDASAHNGLGDIVLKRCDILNLYWEPGITDIQDSPHFFSTSLKDIEALEDAYPEYKGQFSKDATSIPQYNYDDHVDTSKKALVIDWYYKKTVNGRVTVQYVKFVNSVILYASENETEPVTDELGNVIKAPIAETGLYADGKYPFVFDPLFSIEGTPGGYGYTDIGKDTQIQIDMLNNAITQNAMLACKPRWFAREDAAINLGEFLDWNKDIIRVASSDMSDVALRQVDVSPLGSQYIEVLNNRINELKETLGNRDVNTGGTVSGVTTASGIAALQEAGGRIDKASALETYDAQESIAQMVISRIKQFYTTPRYFRILDENGEARYLEYMSQRDVNGNVYVPSYDIDITAEKASPYKAISQNELMLQLYAQRFFDPANAQPALACLDGMDFDGKENIIASIQKNNLIMQQLVKLAALVDAAYKSDLSSQMGGAVPATAAAASTESKLSDEEPAHMQKARRRAEEASQPV